MSEGGAEAFSLLGNETRLRIIESLGDLSDPGEFSTISFSRLYEASEVGDSGTFNYHLQKLTGRFVTSTDDGYKLSLEGITVYRGLRSGIFETDKEGPVAAVAGRRVPAEEPCLECGGPAVVWIEHGRIHLGCDLCGHVDTVYPVPAGGLQRAAEALAADDAASAFAILRERILQDMRAMIRGFCGYCSGEVEVEFSEDTTRVPEPSNVRLGLVVTLSCTYCHWYIHSNLEAAISGHPRVVPFIESRGLDAGTIAADQQLSVDATLLSRAPWRLEATATLETERLRLELDESLRAVDSRVEQVPPKEPPDESDTTGPVGPDVEPLEGEGDTDSA